MTMKTHKSLNYWSLSLAPAAALIGMLTLYPQPLPAAESSASASAASPPKIRVERVILEGDESEALGGKPARRELPWLGVSADEAPEVLTAQLGLEPGVGLVVDYVGEGSPAAKAGLQKNDLLVEFEGQSLVHPAQLRKLVQARKDGDLVKLAFYRAGKKETVTAKLGTTTAGLGLPGDELAWRGDLRELQRQLRDLPVGEEVRRHLENFRETLRQQLGPEQRRQIEVQVRQGVESARRAAHEALQSMTNAGLRELRQQLEELERSGVGVARDARVTVQSHGSEVKTLVESDDSGTYILVSNPTPHLTVHGKDGKLLFDGRLDTPEERAKVPREIWARVEPMLDKLSAKPAAPAPPRPERPKAGGDAF
jgi:hypothetical protein